MRFYDLHVHSAFSSGKSSMLQLAETARELGYSGFCFSSYYEGDSQLKRLREEAAKVMAKVPVEVYLGFEARDAKEMDRLRAARRKFDVLLAQGGDIGMNRKAVETPEVDVLTHPSMGRGDPGMNDVMMRLARKNNVAIEVNFREILNASKETRSRILRRVSQNVVMAAKLKAPVVACSGALSHYEMKDPAVLASLAAVLGMDLKRSKDAVSSVPGSVLKEAGRRRSDRWVMPGVRVVG